MVAPPLCSLAPLRPCEGCAPAADTHGPAPSRGGAPLVRKPAQERLRALLSPATAATAADLTAPPRARASCTPASAATRRGASSGERGMALLPQHLPPVAPLNRTCSGPVRNCTGTVLELYWNCTGTVLELYWNCTGTGNMRWQSGDRDFCAQAEIGDFLIRRRSGGAVEEDIKDGGLQTRGRAGRALPGQLDRADACWRGTRGRHATRPLLSLPPPFTGRGRGRTPARAGAAARLTGVARPHRFATHATNKWHSTSTAGTLILPGRLGSVGVLGTFQEVSNSFWPTLEISNSRPYVWFQRVTKCQSQ
eukprot:gene24829-biopygen22429